MTITGLNIDVGGKDRMSLAIMKGDKLQMVIDRDDLNARRASRKADREFIARALCAIVERHGAIVDRLERRREITLSFDLNGVGALVHIDDCFDGGARSLIHWHNTQHPSRNFTARFCSMVGEVVGARLHHKATSHPADWYSLAMQLDAGLCLAARGEAFEPSRTS